MRVSICACMYMSIYIIWRNFPFEYFPSANCSQLRINIPFEFSEQHCFGMMMRHVPIRIFRLAMLLSCSQLIWLNIPLENIPFGADENGIRTMKEIPICIYVFIYLCTCRRLKKFSVCYLPQSVMLMKEFSEQCFYRMRLTCTVLIYDIWMRLNFPIAFYD
jgi:hypothetical protein